MFSVKQSHVWVQTLSCLESWLGKKKKKKDKKLASLVRNWALVFPCTMIGLCNGYWYFSASPINTHKFWWNSHQGIWQFGGLCFAPLTFQFVGDTLCHWSRGGWDSWNKCSSIWEYSYMILWLPPLICMQTQFSLTVANFAEIPLDLETVHNKQ